MNSDRRIAIEARIVDIAARQHGVVTRAQLFECGLSKGALQRRVALGALRPLHRGVFGLGPFLPARAPIMAAVLAAGSDAILSHRSAALLFGLITATDGAIDVTIRRPNGCRRLGIRAHRVHRLEPDEVTEREGIPVTSPLRTLVDLATQCDIDELERAVARAEREQLVSAHDLATVTSRYRRRCSVARLHAVLQRMGGPALTRSEAESRFLKLIRRARLPAPRVNARVDEYEVDFFWPDHGVAIEVDGYRFHGSRARFESDRRRGSQLAALGVHVVALTWRQIVDDEIATAVLIGRLLSRAERGMR